MSGEISFTRFAHSDTNILSNVAKDLKLWRPLQDFLHSNDLCLAISGAQTSELSDAKRLHEPLNSLLTALPSALIKTADEVLAEEVLAHPKKRGDTLLRYPLNAMLGSTSVEEFLSSSDLAEARRGQRLASEVWMERLQTLKSNFPVATSGRYSKEQADEFSWALTVQELGGSHYDFVKRFQNDVSHFKADVFLSQRIMSYVIFYKYYLADENPKLSDFGDMFHLYDLPYCKLAIVERNMCAFLRQIKRNHDVLDGVTIMNKDLLKDWEWVGD